MAIIGLSTETLGLILITSQEHPGKHLIKSYNIARKYPLWLILKGPQ